MGNQRRKDQLKPFSNKFRNALLNSVTAGDGSKIIRGAKIWLFRDQGNSSRIYSLKKATLPEKSLNSIDEIRTNNIRGSKKEVDIETIWARPFIPFY